MGLMKKIKKRLTYTDIEPLVYSEGLRRSYTGGSVTGGMLSGKRVFITGGSGGIGTALALRFLAEGCKVVISGRNEYKLSDTLDYLKSKRYNSVECRIMDQKDPNSIRNVISREFSMGNIIDILVNNAGVFTDVDKLRKFRTVTQAEYESVVSINLDSTVLLCECVASGMRAADIKGAIINIASICGLEKEYQFTPYGISKAGIIAATKRLSEDYPDIKIDVISPGSVATSMGNLSIGSNIAKRCNILHRPALPEEIASLAAVLSSPLGRSIEKWGGVLWHRRVNDSIKSGWTNYSEIRPLIYTDSLRKSYMGSSLTGCSLKGKTVLITGGSGGIGTALSVRFLLEGCNIIITGRNEDKLKTVTEDIRKSGYSKISYTLMDQKDTDSIKAIIDRLTCDKPLDIVINNAGVLSETDRSGSFGTTKEIFENEIKTNLDGTIAVCRCAAAKMQERKSGAIVNIASICAYEKPTQFTPYGISKAGIIAATQKCKELYPDVSFFAISPGSVATSMNSANVGSNVSKGCNLLHRLALPDEIASLAAILVSPLGKKLSAMENSFVASGCEYFKGGY